jgi:hypothetical protein
MLAAFGWESAANFLMLTARDGSHHQQRLFSVHHRFW